MFPAFLKLRSKDPDTVRPFKVPGGRTMLHIITYVPMILLVVSILFTAVQMCIRDRYNVENAESLENALSELCRRDS